ncbi:MAG: GIY-YIG nuclease family protein [Marinifilaceae bacterium]|nr:GIY-YIG nuclease family protein [Marinifilaceae bacterium]
MWNKNSYVYITTNPKKTVLYIGVTNNLKRRIYEHFHNKGKNTSFAGKYYCYNLVYFEHFTNIEEAIAREK